MGGQFFMSPDHDTHGLSKTWPRLGRVHSATRYASTRINTRLAIKRCIQAAVQQQPGFRALIRVSVRLGGYGRFGPIKSARGDPKKNQPDFQVFETIKVF